MYQPASYLIRFSSSRHCWKHILLRDTLVLNIRHETTEWQMFIVHQRWHCALGQEPLSQHFCQLWTPAISPFLVSFSKPKHFHLVRNKLFPTMCLLWKSDEQQRFGGCPKSSTSGGRNLYARYGLAQSLVCARPAWQRTWQRRFCPVARTQTIILQVVYPGILISKLWIFINHNNLRTIRKLIAYENFQDYSTKRFSAW